MYSLIKFEKRLVKVANLPNLSTNTVFFLVLSPQRTATPPEYFTSGTFLFCFLPECLHQTVEQHRRRLSNDRLFLRRFSTFQGCRRKVGTSLARQTEGTFRTESEYLKAEMC
jgi:hypothetical protein